MQKITIIDYRMGNLASLNNAFDVLGIPVVVTSDRKVVERAERLILPGVGAFAPAMDELKKNSLDGILLKKVHEGVPVLGICLGMQLLFSLSHEKGTWKGLDLIKGEILPFTEVQKVPHMGWNSISVVKEDPLFARISHMYAYFVHSYFCLPAREEIVLAVCEYTVTFCAACRQDNLWGVQFHPEKSQQDGLHLLENFSRVT